MPPPHLGRYLGMLVLDADGLPLGRVAHTGVDPATLGLANLVVGLDPDARGRVGVPASGLALPAQLIAQVGPETIVLTAALDDLRRGGRGCCWVVRPAEGPTAA